MKERARRTCPEGIYIATSGIRHGGDGAWTKIAIPKNTTFGPYEGEIVPTYDIRRLHHVFQGGYSWEVSHLLYFYSWLVSQLYCLFLSYT